MLNKRKSTGPFLFQGLGKENLLAETILNPYKFPIILKRK